jgi:hypothetical protein
VTPLIGSDTSTVDLPALVAEFQTEVQRWRDTSVSVN